MAATGDHDAAMDAASNAGDDARMSDSASSDDGGAHAAIRWSQPAKHALLKRLNSGRVVVFSLPTQRGRGAKKTEKTPRQIGWDEVGADLDASMEFKDPKDRLPKGYATGEKCQKQYKALKAALKQKKASPVDVDDPDSSIEQEILHLTKVVMGLEAAAKSKKKQGKVPQQDARPAEIGAHVRAAAMSSRGSKRAAPDLDPPAGEHPDESQEGGQAGEEYAGEEEEWEEGDEMGGPSMSHTRRARRTATADVVQGFDAMGSAINKLVDLSETQINAQVAAQAAEQAHRAEMEAMQARRQQADIDLQQRELEFRMDTRKEDTELRRMELQLSRDQMMETNAKIQKAQLDAQKAQLEALGKQTDFLFKVMANKLGMSFDAPAGSG
eukprot:jgi/Mesvir1/14148/Mv21725-RA.1